MIPESDVDTSPSKRAPPPAAAAAWEQNPMHLVFESPNLFIVHHFKAVLDEHGIAVHVSQDLMASAGGGEVANPEFWPKLYVLDEKEVARAQRLIEEHRRKE